MEGDVNCRNDVVMISQWCHNDIILHQENLPNRILLTPHTIFKVNLLKRPGLSGAESYTKWKNNSMGFQKRQFQPLESFGIFCSIKFTQICKWDWSIILQKLDTIYINWKFHDFIIDSVTIYVNVTCPKVSLNKHEYFYENEPCEKMLWFFTISWKTRLYTNWHISGVVKLL